MSDNEPTSVAKLIRRIKECEHEGDVIPGLSHWQCDKCGVWIASYPRQSRTPPETEEG